MKLNTHPNDRKEMVRSISELIATEATYLYRKGAKDVQQSCGSIPQNSAQSHGQHFKENTDWLWIFASGCG